MVYLGSEVCKKGQTIGLSKGMKSMGYYENQLKESEKIFYHAIVAGVTAFRKQIPAPAELSKEEINHCITAVFNDHPEIFYVNFHRIRYMSVQTERIYTPFYVHQKKEALQYQERIEKKIQEILEEAQKKNLVSIYQKCAWLHAYLIRNCVYDQEARESPDTIYKAYSIEGVLLDKKAVCRGIAATFKVLCERMGVEVIIVKGRSLQPGSKDYARHAWNLVYGGKEAAQIDVTWDMNLTEEGKPIRYDYFFLPDIEMMRDHQYVGYPICRQLQSTYFERTGTLFKEFTDLEQYVRNILVENGDMHQKGMYQLYFKLRNKNSNVETIRAFVEGVIRESTMQAYQYTVYYNERHLVFFYKIEFLES